MKTKTNLKCPRGHAIHKGRPGDPFYYCLTCGPIVECRSCGWVGHKDECRWIGNRAASKFGIRRNPKDSGVYGLCPQCQHSIVTSKYRSMWLGRKDLEKDCRKEHE